MKKFGILLLVCVVLFFGKDFLIEQIKDANNEKYMKWQVAQTFRILQECTREGIDEKLCTAYGQALTGEMWAKTIKHAPTLYDKEFAEREADGLLSSAAHVANEIAQTKGYEFLTSQIQKDKNLCEMFAFLLRQDSTQLACQNAPITLYEPRGLWYDLHFIFALWLHDLNPHN